MSGAPSIMTVPQAAEYLQVDEETVRRLARLGRIPAGKVGSHWRFRRADLDDWIAAGGTRYEALVDQGLMMVVEERKAGDTGERIPWEEVKARYGL